MQGSLSQGGKKAHGHAHFSGTKQMGIHSWLDKCWTVLDKGLALSFGMQKKSSNVNLFTSAVPLGWLLLFLYACNQIVASVYAHFELWASKDPVSLHLWFQFLGLLG